jgi:YfiH family protein
VPDPAPVLLTSPLLTAAGIPHAFSTRIGGVSAAPFDSLNLGNPSELPRDKRDPPENIRENFRRILAGIGCEDRTLTEVHQVHAAAVHVAGPVTDERSPDPKADAIVTRERSRVLAIRVADCAPVLLATPDGSMVAAVHAGWRGVVAGVLPAAISAMQRLGARELLAAMGPCIGPDHFEVGPEVAEQFDRLFRGMAAAPVLRAETLKPHLDLKAALRAQLTAAGVERTDVLPHCTWADSDLFFSHRRDRGVTGRTAAVIAVRGA